MNQEEFLQRLAAALAPLSDAERACIIDYYREMICDGVESGKLEQELIAGFGTAQEIAAQILEESRTASGEHAEVPAMPPAQSASDAYAAQGPVHSIIVDARHTSVEVHSVQDGPVQVHFIPTERDHVTVSENSGTFSFHHTVEFSFFHWRDLFYMPHRIIVDVPVNFAGELHVSTCNAGLIAADLSGLSTAQFVTSNAHLTVSNIICGNLSARTSNGPLNLQNVHGRSCTAETSNNRITADDCSFPDGLHLYTSNAAVHAQNVISDNVEFATSNGLISAVIVGDMREYAIRSHTSNASSTLPPELVYPEQKKYLNVSTNNARIEVRFVSKTF